MSSNIKHRFHLVDPSPWPLITSVAALMLTSGSVLYFHHVANAYLLSLTGFIFLAFSMGIWWRDVIREATFEGHHTKIVQKGLRLGVILFIVSEVMFFVAFFWAYFHSSLAPTFQIGAVWPPIGIQTFNPWGVPLLNTVILLLSGATCTWAHEAIIYSKNKDEISLAFICTLVLAIFFTGFQVMEYKNAAFTIADGIYGSCFFLATGFHGAHVIIGTTFLTICFLRSLKNHFTSNHHFGFEAAAWYWHFVDVVWLFLFVWVYVWGAGPSNIEFTFK